MKEVPEAHTPMQSIRLHSTPGIVFSINSSEMPPIPLPPVRTATAGQSRPFAPTRTPRFSSVLVHKATLGEREGKGSRPFTPQLIEESRRLKSL